MNSSVEQGGSPLNSMAQAGEDDVLTGAAVPVAPAVTSPTDAPVVRADGGELHLHVCRVLCALCCLLTLAHPLPLQESIEATSREWDMIWAAVLGDGTGGESWKTALSSLLAMGCKEVGYPMPPILLAAMPFTHVMFANTRVRAAEKVGSRSDVLVINAVMLAGSGVGKVRTHLHRRAMMSSVRLDLSRVP